MRRIVAASLLMAAIAVPEAARAVEPIGDPVEVTFEALPCAAVCADWLAFLNCDIECKDPDIYFQACDAPFPLWGYDDVAITAPENARVLMFESRPTVNWDTFICAPDGEELAVGPDCPPYECDPPGSGRVPIAAPESLTILVRPGERLVLRAYNWLDAFPLTGTYTFFSA